VVAVAVVLVAAAAAVLVVVVVKTIIFHLRHLMEKVVSCTLQLFYPHRRR
jgi:hypothetical protein